MTHPELAGKRVLVIEDEMLVALLVEELLAAIGCVVVGPFARVRHGLAAATAELVDFALLDVNVAGEKVFPVAYALEERGVPFLFVTGYGDAALPPDRSHWEAVSKPFQTEQLVNRLVSKFKQVPAARNQKQLVPIGANGSQEEVSLTSSYSSVNDGTSSKNVAGVLVIGSEPNAQLADAQPAAVEQTSAGALNYDSGVLRLAGDSSPAGRIVSSIDMTDQHEAVRKLRESEERLRLAIEAADVGLWDVDLVTDTLYWPPRVKAMFGISADVPVSMADYYNGLHPVDFARTSAAFATALDPNQRAVYDVEYRTIGKEDGVIRWVAAKGRGIFEGDRCVRAIGTAIDITERKALEEKLQELNQTLERRVAEGLAEKKVLIDIIETTDAFVQVVDLDYRFLAINKASAREFERIFGVLPKAGDSMLDLLDGRPEHKEAVKAIWARALAGEEFTAVAEFGDPAFDRRHYEMKFNSLRDPEGGLVGAFQFVYDVTDRVRDQQRLAKVESQLRQAQKIDAIGLLTGGVAHDFNNLLMVISGGLSLLEQSDDVERTRRVVSGMRQAAERGASLTKQLLRFSRRQPLKPEAIDLRVQIGGMHELLDRALRGDVHVETKFVDDLWAVEADPSELELVVLNLAVNARDAMPNGGVITIRAENLPDIDDARLSGDYVSLTVSDTGTGMSDEVLAHLFEPFFTTKEIGAGSGLGLPQVYGFAQQSGGTVEVDSVVGKGTTVRLLLPRSPNVPRTRSSTLVPTPTAARRGSISKSILVVEDDNEVGALVTEMLTELGCSITRAASAEAALGALADGRSIDLVFSDVMMPGPLNGVELAQEIRRRSPNLPVLLTSGYAEAAFRKARAENIGVLLKPYDLTALETAVREALSKGVDVRGH